MTQMTFEFFQPAVENEKEELSIETIKENLTNYIKVCGLIAYKDFYMKIKGGFTAIPKGVTKEQYLVLAREVYESRAAKVNRDKGRAKFFAIRNANKRRTKS